MKAHVSVLLQLVLMKHTPFAVQRYVLQSDTNFPQFSFIETRILSLLRLKPAAKKVTYFVSFFPVWKTCITKFSSEFRTTIFKEVAVFSSNR
jgi:hypothetical protein